MAYIKKKSGKSDRRRRSRPFIMGRSRKNDTYQFRVHPFLHFHAFQPPRTTGKAHLHIYLPRLVISMNRTKIHALWLHLPHLSRRYPHGEASSVNMICIVNKGIRLTGPNDELTKTNLFLFLGRGDWLSKLISTHLLWKWKWNSFNNLV